MRQRIGYIRELGYGLEEWFEVTRKVPDKAIGQVGADLRVLFQQVAEAEAAIVEGIDEAAHCFHAAAHLVSVVAESSRGVVFGSESGIDGIRNEFAAS